MTEAWLTKTPMAPAMKKAGTRHSSTCSWAYHLISASDSKIALLKRGHSIGKAKQAAKTATPHTSFFHSDFQSLLMFGYLAPPCRGGRSIRSQADGGPLGLEVLFQDGLEALPEALETRALEAVVDQGAFAAVVDEAGLPQDGQVLRHGGLVRADEVGEFADAEFALRRASSIIRRLGWARALAIRARAS